MNHIDSLTTQVKTQQLVITDLVQTNQTYHQINSDTKTNMTNLQVHLSHIEQGAYDFGDSNRWRVVKSTSTLQTKYIKFSKSYPRPPMVHIGVSKQWFWSSDHITYRLELMSVDEHGFEMGVHSVNQGDSVNGYYRLRGFAVTWISFPQ